MAEETNSNPNADKTTSHPPANPNAGESRTPEASKEHAPSTDQPEPTDFPTANDPDPGKTPAEKKSAAKKPADKATEAKPAAKAAKAKKEKPPAVEDKPFTEFVQQDYLPALKTAFAEQGIEAVDLSFVKEKIPIRGLSQGSDCWQVVGSWQNGDRQFNVYFPDEDITKQKAFSCGKNGAKPSTLESFMIDERKVTLDLLVFYTMQRLNAQKWLAWN